MPSLTQPLRDEHRGLLPHIEHLRRTGDLVGEVPLAELRRAVAEVHEFLTDHLTPHAQAEEVALYPVVGRVMGAAEATATMSRDHVEVGRLTDELTALQARLSAPVLGLEDAKALRRVLYGLYALVKVHFAKEEEVYLPLLDARLEPAEGRRMFDAMHTAAKEAKREIRAERAGI